MVAHEGAEIQLKALRRGKNLAFSKNVWFEKEIVLLKVAPRQMRMGLKRNGKLNKKRLGWRLTWWGYPVKKKAKHFSGLRGRH